MNWGCYQSSILINSSIIKIIVCYTIMCGNTCCLPFVFGFKIDVNNLNLDFFSFFLQAMSYCESEKADRLYFNNSLTHPGISASTCCISESKQQAKNSPESKQQQRFPVQMTLELSVLVASTDKPFCMNHEHQIASFTFTNLSSPQQVIM